MCGISVIVALQGANHTSVRAANGPLSNGVNGVHVKGDKVAAKIAIELDQSLDIIAHRGPDSRGQWISDDKRVGPRPNELVHRSLGHCRLAIQDLSPDGYQPIHDAEDKIHAVVNGEFYDHERIRAELSLQDNYKFKGCSDSEIAIALYKKHGLSFLRYLRGEWALCLYDSEKKFFIAARDRYGVKPMFWTIVDGRLLIAAEVKAFLPLGWKPEWDVESLLDGGWNHDQRTLFKNVYKVRPGHYLTCSSFNHIEHRQYWDADYPDKRIVETRTEEEMIEGVRSRMLESIRLRLRADVPVGIYLSGGIDSSVIAGMVTHLVKEQGTKMGDKDTTDRITCFSIAFDEESGFDELAIANRTADHLNVKFEKKLMNEQELVNRFEDAVWHCEHHNPDLNLVGKYALSEVPLEHGYKVVLTGEGADEIFGGYPVYLPDYLREPDHTWPANLLQESDRHRKCQLAEHEAAAYYRSVGADAGNRAPSIAGRQLNNITTVASMAAFQFPHFAEWTKCYGACDPRVTIANNADGHVRDLIASKWHPLHAAEYIWSKGHLANIFLSCLGDRTEMAHSIEARTPFLDHHLAEYVNNLPPSLKIHYNPSADVFVEKWILREAARPFITKELYERKKHPYSAPTTWPRGGPLHRLLSRLVTRENVEALGFVDWNAVRTLVDDGFGDEGRPSAMRTSLLLAEWVVIGQRFGVRKAEAPREL